MITSAAYLPMRTGELKRGLLLTPPNTPSLPASPIPISDLWLDGEREDRSKDGSFSSLPLAWRGGIGLDGGVWNVSFLVSVPIGEGEVDPRRLSEDVAGEAEREDPGNRCSSISVLFINRVITLHHHYSQYYNKLNWISKLLSPQCSLMLDKTTGGELRWGRSWGAAANTYGRQWTLSRHDQRDLV